MIKIKKLNCGIRVCMEKNDFIQSAAIGFWVKTGAVDETKKYAGISHFVEHMMFKGTSNRNALEIAEDIDKIGGQINAFTGKEATCYYVKTLSENLIKSTEVLIDMLVNSSFDKEEMNRERNVICEEIKMINDSPDDHAHELFNKALYGDSALGNSISGTYSSLKNISQRVIKEYVENEYTRDSIVVAVAGNFNEDEICDYIENKLSSLKATKEKKEYKALEYKPSFKCSVRDIEQSHIYLGVPALDVFDRRHYAMTILTNILGGSMSSRLFQSVREQKGLAYSVYAAHSVATLGGHFIIYAGVAHENVKACIGAIKEEINKLKTGGVTFDELNKAKEQIKSNYIFGQENVASKMFGIGKSVLLKGEARSDKEVLDLINGVTLEDIDEVIKIISDFENYTAVAVSNKKLDLKKIMLGA